MRLTPKAVRAIQRGEKTQHRVLVTDPEPRQRRNGTTYLSQPFRPSVGQSVPVQPETRDPATGVVTLEQVRVVVAATKKALLGDITTDQAHAEGHPTIAEFADQWMRLHSTVWPPKTEALCKECDGWGEYEDHDGQTVPCDQCEIGVIEVDAHPTPVETIDRFERKHAHHLVWVVTFELLSDVPLYLNKRAYLPPTTSLSEALEPVEILGPPRPDWKQRAEARHRATLRDRDGARLAGLSSEWDRLQELKRLADERGIDSVKVIRRANQQLEDKVRRAPDTTRRAA